MVIRWERYQLAVSDLFHTIFHDLLFPTFEVPNPYCYRCPDQANCKNQCLGALEELVAAKHSEIAAIILEPVMQGAAGMIPNHPDISSGSGK